MSSAIKYNERSAKENGWEPEWFGASGFNSELIERIRDFQGDHGLTADGLCGPSTYRRKFTERASELDEVIPDSPPGKDFILCHNEPISIDWDKVVTWNEPGGMEAPKGTYTPHTGNRDPRIFVNHWDVCLSSGSCFRVLKKRGISVHFLIDNDGTIYQTLDTCHIGWHAGRGNKASIGVEISNAYYPKYQNWYVRKGFGERPVMKGYRVNGRRLKDHLGFYPVQIEATVALWKAINKAYDIPLVCPSPDGYTMESNTSPDVVKGNFRGIIHHYHLTERKIDCGSFDLMKYLKED